MRWALVGFLVGMSGLLGAAEPAVVSLEDRWRKAAILYNSGFYDAAAEEFEALARDLPQDSLTQKYLRQSRNAVSFGTRMSADVPESRSFAVAAATQAVLSPTEQLPGIGAQPAVAVSITTPVLDKAAREKIYNNAVILFNEGKYDQSIKEFEKILQQDPDHAPSLLRVKKAQEALEKGNFNEP